MIKVLIVDDEPYIRQGLKLLIDWGEYGYEIVGEAQNGFEAIQMLQQEHFDLVMVDIKMPRMDGIELIAYVRERLSKRVKFIISTGYSDFSYAKSAIQYNVSNYLLKPIQPQELGQTLKKLKVEVDQQKKASRQKKRTDKILCEYYLLAAITGKQNVEINKGLRHFFAEKGRLLYVHVEFERFDSRYRRLSETGRRECWWDLYKGLSQSLGNFRHHLISNVTKLGDTFDLGIVLTGKLLKSKGMDEYEYVEYLKNITQQIQVCPVSFYMGLKVDGIEQIALSYKSAIEASLQRHRDTGDALLDQIEAYIKEHYMEDLSLKSLSEKYFINCAYLGQVFKKRYHIFFRDYLNAVRIKKAAELLKTSDSRIYHIAKDVGYNSVDHFINKFTEIMGVSPNRYRRNPKLQKAREENCH